MVESLQAKPVLLWFRDDLRLADNPALDAAVSAGAPVVALFVHDERSPGMRHLGGAARWWLHRSLTSLTADLRAHGIDLLLRSGEATDVVPAIARAIRAATVHWNRPYGPAAAVDDAVAAALAASSVAVRTFDANLLFPPGSVCTTTGAPYRVFTAFWRAALRSGGPLRQPLPAPTEIQAHPTTADSLPLDALGLHPSGHDWSGGIGEVWQPGEAGAHRRLAAFAGRIAGYAEKRDYPSANATSMLSPHLRFGEISPFQLWHAVASRTPDTDRSKFLSELGRREFSWHLFADRPDLAIANLNRAFDDFRWGDSYAHDVWAWRRGRTGYPIVDAGMRQLWREGWMPNRIRMIAASFLIKHLLTDWRIGEEWFWDTLVDADPASNPVNWQWVAGSGADAQPFFRIFNPVLQGEKFDAAGAYVRRHLPELARLPDRFVHKPWQAPQNVLAEAGIRLGTDYPLPIVDHAVARRRALDAFAALGR